MGERSKCIYRISKDFKLCQRDCSLNSSFFCRYHMKSKYSEMYKTYYTIFGNKCNLNINDIYFMYKYVNDKIECKDININREIFIEMLKNIPRKNLQKISLPYVKNKKDLYNILYNINRCTYAVNNKLNINTIVKAQEKIQYKSSIRKDILRECINSEELFTCVNICDIPKNNLFILINEKSYYAFDAIELDYFIRKCINDNVIPYNPYTRDLLCEKDLRKLKIFIKYNKISIRNNECLWETEMHGYTDLSIEIERRGFYNNPIWFSKMKSYDFLKTIKYFRDFSNNIEQHKLYFNNINANTLSFDFCKDGIKMFRECKDDLYILCCNFIKALALCSRDFYENLPDWILNIHTQSYSTNMMNVSNEMTNNNVNNFLLYYYVEYM